MHILETVLHLWQNLQKMTRKGPKNAEKELILLLATTETTITRNAELGTKEVMPKLFVFRLIIT